MPPREDKDNSVLEDHHVSPARFSSLETKVENLEVMVTRFDAKLSSIAASLQSKGQWDWRSIFAGVSVLLILIGAFFTAAMTPIVFMVKHAEQEQHKLQDTVRNVSKEVEADTTSLQELHVKVAWLNDTINVMNWQGRQQMALLWKKTFSEEMPQSQFLNLGPGQMMLKEIHE